MQREHPFFPWASSPDMTPYEHHGTFIPCGTKRATGDAGDAPDLPYKGQAVELSSWALPCHTSLEADRYPSHCGIARHSRYAGVWVTPGWPVIK